MMLVIFGVSSLEGGLINEVGLGKESIQINGHFVLFTLLCLTYYKALKNSFQAFLLTIVYAFSDELHQVFVAGRSASMFDIFVDTCGALLAVIIVWKLKPLLPKKLNNWLSK